MSPWPEIVAGKLHGTLYRCLANRKSDAPHPTWWPENDGHTQMCKHKNIHSSHSAEPFQITAPSLIPSCWCSWSKAQQQWPLRWVRVLPTAGCFPAPPNLIQGDPSALITHGQDSPGKQALTRKLTHMHAHKQTNQGHQAKWNLIRGNKLIRSASIWCVLWIRVCGFVWVPNPGHELHSVWIIKLPQFW